jgi:signal transduction histidine kinase
LFLNLADNAVKYNKPGGRVTFTLRKDHEDAVVTVTNTGSGILPAELPRVFDRFFRGDAAHKCRQDGCGLGLSIVHWIVTAHGGSMAINSERDELTKVAVRLPTGRARKMPDVDRAETRAVAIPRSQNPSVARAA